jgi:hypothetical protein
MMADRKLDWSKASMDGRGVLTVPIEPPPDETWINVFKHAGVNFGNEIRGQQYRDIRIDDDRLVVTGTNPGNPKPTADFLDAWVQKANELAEQWRRQGEQAAAMAERRAAEDAVAAERATQELRERS